MIFHFEKLKKEISDKLCSIVINHEKNEVELYIKHLSKQGEYSQSFSLITSISENSEVL